MQTEQIKCAYEMHYSGGVINLFETESNVLGID